MVGFPNLFFLKMKLNEIYSNQQLYFKNNKYCNLKVKSWGNSKDSRGKAGNLLFNICLSRL